MKLKYRAWVVKGPQASRYSYFPVDMLRYDPAYIHLNGLKYIEEHRINRGPRPELPDTWSMIYTHIPGYLAINMNPTIGRWASFGWSDITRHPALEGQAFDLKRASEWVGVVGFKPNGAPVTVTLADWITIPTMDKWSNHVSRVKAEQGALRL